MINLDNNFLVVRYPHGAAGKFLSSVLMSSSSVAHFDPAVEQDKNFEKCLQYIIAHFTKNIKDWLLHEPKPSDAWNLHFLSSTYARGNELTTDEFSKNCKKHASEHFWNCVSSKKKITIAWHKTEVPEFLKCAKFITVIIDPRSVKWFHRALWYKHYEIKDRKIHIKTHDPHYNSTMQRYYSRFQNNMYSDDSFCGFVRKNIINHPQKLTFASHENFVDIDQEFVLLSELLSKHTFSAVIDRICQRFGLDTIESKFVTDSHTHWMSCHEFKYSNIY